MSLADPLGQKRSRLGLIAMLLVMGAAWGITQPLSKIAVSEGYRHFGIIFWQFAIGAVILGAICVVRGRGLPFARRHLILYTVIAVIGTILPHSASYTAAIHLPAGIISICIATVPMLSFPIALALGMDRLSAMRVLGLGLGFAAILLIALPQTSLPDAAMVAWLPMALIAPLFYAIEGNYVARLGTEGLEPVQVLLGASLVGMVILAPVSIMSGQWITPSAPFGRPDWAIIGSAVAHAGTYAAYVWLVGRAGAVFAAQVAYLVTGSGIIWSKLILDETYSIWVWGALVLMLAGVFLVQPRTTQDDTPAARPAGARDAPNGS